ncbi:hypothetical protein [Bythopirellula goksoeyrii]|uniref:Uncharacterized protein n=1 Tax=Bythopirellula goksoeyrii TaxID=1400387 RepID=A0A5B9QE44_9BACT|nr:hypothetical protein [Bythopirellula goksoeyrii]QEG35910.1 hypothetical protein Pr1d_32170 [Bythopirellula goksoeyrii]
MIKCNTDKPIGEIVLVGRAAYQLYSHTYRGVVQYRAKVGKPWTNAQTGETLVLPFMQDDSARDFMEASRQAGEQVEALRAAQFRQVVHTSAASITPLAKTTEQEFEADKPLGLKLA